jgi:hypothetical protein
MALEKPGILKIPGFSALGFLALGFSALIKRQQWFKNQFLGNITTHSTVSEYFFFPDNLNLMYDNFPEFQN